MAWRRVLEVREDLVHYEGIAEPFVTLCGMQHFGTVDIYQHVTESPDDSRPTRRKVNCQSCLSAAALIRERGLPPKG